jgi:hypothetical protein
VVNLVRVVNVVNLDGVVNVVNLDGVVNVVNVVNVDIVADLSGLCYCISGQKSLICSRNTLRKPHEARN